MVAGDLRRAVDWKLFELTSCLISDEVSPEDFEQSKLWFQERHAQDVVEERFTCGMCAYPLCTNPLKTYHKAPSFKDRNSSSAVSPTKSLVTTADTKYRVDYATKQIYHVERSKYYCSDTCLTAGETWIARLDGISPYARSQLTKNLLKKDANFSEKRLQSEKIPIEEVLALLDHSSPTKAKDTVPLSSSSSTAMDVAESTAPVVVSTPRVVDGDAPPPAYDHAHITAEGAVRVQVIHGTPHLQSAALSATDAASEKPLAASLDVSRLVSTAATKLQQLHSHDVAPAATAVATETASRQPAIRKVRPTALRGAAVAAAASSADPATVTATAATEAATPATQPSVEALLADMAALQMKYGLSGPAPGASSIVLPSASQPSAAAEPAGKDAAIAAAASTLPTPPSAATDSSQSLDIGTGRDRVAAVAVSARGPKTVSWDTPTAPPPPSAATTAATAVAAAEPAKAKAASQRAGVTRKGPLVALKIVERDNVQPLSAAALPTKREPSATVAAESSSVGSLGAAAVSTTLEEDARERYRRAMMIEGHSLNASNK